MTKHEWSMSVLAVCVCGIAGVVTAVVVVRACGATGLTVAQGWGVLLVVLAFGLLAGCLNLVRWAASKLAVRRMWRRVDRARRIEQARLIRESAVREFDKAMTDYETFKRSVKGR
jgi:hypothetical protein